MPNLGPETYSFGIYVHYDDATPQQPRLVVYLSSNEPPKDEESERLQQHAEDEDLEATLVITRTVTEDQFHQSTKHYRFSISGRDGVAVQSAADYLKQLHPAQFNEFLVACWTAAWGRAHKSFPLRFPGDSAGS
jgi:hypothetical protein